MNKRIYWIVSAIIIKLTFSIIFITIHQHGHSINKFYGRFGGDSSEYIGSIENFIKQGHYITNPQDIRTSTRRMPGYGAVYYFPRLLFTQANALNILIILQILLSAVSVYYLALTAYLIFQKKTIFYITFFLYVFSTFVSIFDDTVLTESFSTSSLIFAFYFLIKTLNTNSKKPLFFSGLFLSWCVFMKPYFILFFPLFVIVLLSNYFFKQPKQLLRLTFINLIIFISSFSILESLWIFRNYKIYHYFVPLAYVDTSLETTVSKLAPFALIIGSRGSLYNFIQIIGGRWTQWNPKSEGCWVEGFGHTADYWNPIYELPKNNPFPNFIYTSKYNFNSLVNMRKIYLMAHDINLSIPEREKYEKMVTSILKDYTNSFIKEHPFHYYVTARLRHIYLFLFHSGTYNLLPVSFNKMTFTEKIIKIIFSLLYLFIIIGGLLGIILILFKKCNILTVSLCIMPLYFIVLFAMILRNPTYRFFVPAYPFMVVLSSHILSRLYWKE